MAEKKGKYPSFSLFLRRGNILYMYICGIRNNLPPKLLLLHLPV